MHSRDAPNDGRSRSGETSEPGKRNVINLLRGGSYEAILRGTAALGAALVAAPVLGYAQAVNLDQYVDTGKHEYQSSCAICHGDQGKGDGTFNVLLKKKAADLTVLSKNNGGVFPVNRTYEIISGATDVVGHGPRNMPIWGDHFKAQAASELAPSSKQTDVRAFVRARILALVEYISTLQEK
jgi:mono/diheme cytochrome c family protein